MYETFEHTADLGLRIRAPDLDTLFAEAGRALLYHFDAEHLLLSRFEVRVHEGGLEGRAWGEPLDRSRHELGHEVKAITYHGLCLRPEDGGWLAEVIVDI